MLALQPVSVHGVAVEVWGGEGDQQEVEAQQARQVHQAQEHSVQHSSQCSQWCAVGSAVPVPLARLRGDHVTKIWEPHEITEGVHQERGSEVTGPDEEVGGVHAEHSGVGELEHRK